MVAILLYFWESTLWLPLRGIALRKRWFGNRWKALDPTSLIATREIGLVPMLPFPPDFGLAPCQAPSLFADENGLFLETTDGRIEILDGIGWEDLKEDTHHLLVGNRKIRITSKRCIEILRRAKQRGEAPEAAARQAMWLAFSPSRAAREWKRWRLVSSPLRIYGPVLALGFFAGLPLAYVKLGTLPTLVLALWLWCVMAWTGCHLWWLGKRVYPGARSALRTDALLALIVPFHAMRAMEMASVHAVGTTHPVGLILSSGDFDNPWLGGFVRRVLHPMSGVTGDNRRANALRIPLVRALARCGREIEEFDTAPDRSSEPEAVSYCPRCHGLFLPGVETCADCHGMKLRRF
ncbi:hypothetical protein [Luteolibacter sp.]|uniref:hypothetical protein n=1 Tax=Luteolibacter sp. TaxID=1962973 RepID=UPI0032630D7C